MTLMLIILLRIQYIQNMIILMCSIEERLGRVLLGIEYLTLGCILLVASLSPDGPRFRCSEFPVACGTVAAGSAQSLP